MIWRLATPPQEANAVFILTEFGEQTRVSGYYTFRAMAIVSRSVLLPRWKTAVRRSPPCLRQRKGRHFTLSAASPLLPRPLPQERGSKKLPPMDGPKQLFYLEKPGAGEGIRTLDPNLGKVVRTGHRTAGKVLQFGPHHAKASKTLVSIW